MSFEHVSVMLMPTVDMLNVRDGGIYVDGTLGGGGHSAAAGATVLGTLQDGQAAILRAIHTATGLPVQEDA